MSRSVTGSTPWAGQIINDRVWFLYYVWLSCIIRYYSLRILNLNLRKNIKYWIREFDLIAHKKAPWVVRLFLTQFHIASRDSATTTTRTWKQQINIFICEQISIKVVWKLNKFSKWRINLARVFFINHKQELAVGTLFGGCWICALFCCFEFSPTCFKSKFLFKSIGVVSQNPCQNNLILCLMESVFWLSQSSTNNTPANSITSASIRSSLFFLQSHTLTVCLPATRKCKLIN